MTDKDKFIYLMKYHWKEVSHYIELVWDKRTNIIYDSAWHYCVASRLTYILLYGD